MARQMSAVRLYDEIERRFQAAAIDEAAVNITEESKTTVAEFKEWLILVSFDEARATAERKRVADEARLDPVPEPDDEKQPPGDGTDKPTSLLGDE